MATVTVTELRCLLRCVGSADRTSQRGAKDRIVVVEGSAVSRSDSTRPANSTASDEITRRRDNMGTDNLRIVVPDESRRGLFAE